MLFSEEMMKSIQSGIEQGMVNEGLELGSRDKFIIEASVKTTLYTLEKLIKGDSDNGQTKY